MGKYWETNGFGEKETILGNQVNAPVRISVKRISFFGCESTLQIRSN
jgi:hypothetical protein